MERSIGHGAIDTISGDVAGLLRGTAKRREVFGADAGGELEAGARFAVARAENRRIHGDTNCRASRRHRPRHQVASEIAVGMDVKLKP